MKFTAWFYIFVGILMIGQWSFFIAVGSVPEIKTEPLRLAFHLAGELITAGCLVISGIGLIRRNSWSRALGLIAGGLLAYSVIVSPGYFAQQGQWPLVGMFAVLLVLDAISVRLLIAKKPAI